MDNKLSVLIALFSISPQAEELHTFKNGEVADADDLNQSLNFLLAEIELLKARVSALEPPSRIFLES